MAVVLMSHKYSSKDSPTRKGWFCFSGLEPARACGDEAPRLFWGRNLLVAASLFELRHRVPGAPALETTWIMPSESLPQELVVNLMMLISGSGGM